MALVPYIGSGNEPTSSQWPNFFSVMRGFSSGGTIVSHLAKLSLKTAVACNIPFRAAVLYRGIKEKKYVDSALSVAALAALFLPGGFALSVAIDLTAESIRYMDHRFPLTASTEEESSKPKWPNTSSGYRVLAIGITVFSHLTELSLINTTALALPFRAVAIYRYIQEKNYPEAALSAAAFVVLFLPNGLVLSVVIDLGAECFNYVQNPPPRRIKPLPWPDKPDPAIPENARGMFQIAPDAPISLEYIDERRALLISDIKNRKERATIPALKASFQVWIEDVETAYKVLKAQIPANT